MQTWLAFTLRAILPIFTHICTHACAHARTQPVAASSRMLASTKGKPVFPWTHRSYRFGSFTHGSFLPVSKGQRKYIRCLLVIYVVKS